MDTNGVRSAAGGIKVLRVHKGEGLHISREWVEGGRGGETLSLPSYFSHVGKIFVT